MLRKKTKKKKPLTLFTKQKLHSKSTYFYSKWLDFLSFLRKQFTNGFWENLSSLREDSRSPEAPSAIQTRLSRKVKNPCSGIARLGSTYFLPVACSLALLLVLGCMINPFLPGGDEEKAYAEEGIVEQAGTTGMSVSLTMANPDQTLLQQNAKAGEMSYISSGFTVKTENVDGYNVYVQTAPGSTNKLTNGNLSIDFVTTETPVSGFTDNTWGYAVDDTGTTVENLKYNPIPDTASAMNPAYTSSSTGETRNFTLNFATKFGSNATPGHYTSGVLLSVAAGAEETAKTWDELVYMQDMNPTACSQAPLNTQKTLIDSRDGSTYTIARIKNQTNDEAKCWMTQNLRLVGDRTLTPEDSDVSGEYALPVSVVLDSANDSPKQFSENDQYQSKVYYENNTVNGAYYNFYTVTAGTGNAVLLSGNAFNSICPKNWKLPNTSPTNMFYQLLSGLTVEQAMGEPYFFVKGGTIVDGEVELNSIGNMARYWSGTANSTAGGGKYANLFGFGTGIGDSKTLGFQVIMPRYHGMNVRCVAR